MKGIELSSLYYATYGKNMIREKFPDYEKRIAVGLVGQGSECFMYDDILSTDHDFGPGFCMWLTDEDYAAIGEELSDMYDTLPKEFLGFKRMETKRAGARVGVFRIGDFYENFIGSPDVPATNTQWLRIPERLLATATNGKVFRDDLGEFSRIRNALLKFYPEDVRIKKIAARAAIMAQSGQYNYSRCMKREDDVAASLALSEFVSSTMSMIYLLNKRYAPYYKWLHRGLSELPKLSEAGGMLKELVDMPSQSANWKNLDEITFIYGVNFKDSKVEMIEKICSMVLKELVNQGLANDGDAFLELHVDEIIEKISDMKLRIMHVMDA